MKQSLLHLQNSKNYPKCHWSPAQPEISALWRQQQDLLQGWGISGRGVGLLFPRGWAVRSFPEREKLEGVFLAAATQGGRGELLHGLGRGLGPQQGWALRQAGSQPHTCGMSWLQDRLFCVQKTKLVLELLHIHPELSLTATAPLLGSSLVGESPQQTLTRLLEGEATSPCRNPLVPAPALRATMPGALQGFPYGQEKQLPSLQGPGLTLPPCTLIMLHPAVEAPPHPHRSRIRELSPRAQGWAPACTG